MRFIYFITLILFINCSENNENLENDSLSTDESKGYLGLKIEENPYEDSFVFEELEFNKFKFDIYSTLNDYLGETNKVYSGNFNDKGEISILNSNLIPSKSYYIDIYSTDNLYSNWCSSEFNHIKFNATYSSSLQTLRVFKNKRNLIGEWKFVEYIDRFNNPLLTTERNSLIINKDFSMTSNEYYNNTEFIVKYDIGCGYVQLSSISPSEEKYPTEGAFINGYVGYTTISETNSNLMTFRNFTMQFAIYEKVN